MESGRQLVVNDGGEAVPFLALFLEAFPDRSTVPSDANGPLEVTTLETYTNTPDYDDGPGGG